MDNGDDLCFFAQHGFKRLKIERTVLKNRYIANDRAFAFSQEMPRDNIGVMFHLGNDDLIPRLDHM